MKFAFVKNNVLICFWRPVERVGQKNEETRADTFLAFPFIPEPSIALITCRDCPGHSTPNTCCDEIEKRIWKASFALENKIIAIKT